LALVQLVTLSRAVAAFVFASIAFIPKAELVTLIVFSYAALTDVADGMLARGFRVASDGGAALDIACDKYLTIFSLLYAVAAGAPLVPCCVALTRDIFVQAFRVIRVGDRPLFRPRRTLGVFVVVPIRFLTFYILVLRCLATSISETTVVTYLSWICALTSSAVLAFTLMSDWTALRQAFES
jgi:phosphatidylglycerophosphate synthase